MNQDNLPSVINKDRLVDLNNDIVSFLYNYTKCIKCQGIPIKPYYLSNENNIIFCHDCLEKENNIQEFKVTKETIPNFILKTLQEKIKFKCQNLSFGCKFVISFDKAQELFIHEKCCDFSKIKCLNKKCKVELLKKDIDEHIDKCDVHILWDKIQKKKKNVKVNDSDCAIKVRQKSDLNHTNYNIIKLREENNYLKEKMNIIENQNQKIINCLENSLFCKEKYKYIKNDFYISILPLQTNLLDKTINHYGPNSNESCEIYLNQGILFYNTSQYDNSSSYLNKYVETLINKGNSSDSKNFILPYYYLGMISYYKYLESSKGDKLSLDNKELLKEASKLIQDSLRLATLHKSENEMCDCYNGLGLIFEEFSDFNASKDWHMKALEKRKQLYGEKNDRITGDYNNNLGIVFNNLGKYKESINFHVKALQIYKKTIGKSCYEIGNTYYNLGQAYINNNDLKNSLRSFNTALKIYKNQDINKEEDVSSCLNKIGSIYLEKEKYLMAYKNFKSALRKMKLSNNKVEKSNIYISIGFCLSNLKNYTLSNKYYTTAENILTKNDLNNEKLVTILIGIGQNHFNLNEMEKSLEYYEKAESAVINFNGPVSIELYKIYQDISSILTNLEDHSKSIIYLNKALEIGNDFKLNEFEIADIYYYLGEAYSKLKNHRLAIENMKKCMKVYEDFKGKNDIGVALCLLKIGINNIELKNYEEAIKIFSHAIHMYKISGVKETISELTQCFINIADSYCFMEDEDSAIKILREAKKLFKDREVRNSEFYREIKSKWRKIRGKTKKKETKKN